MNLNATFRPIDRWPGELSRRRQPSRFRAPWPETLDLLKRELAYLGARDVVIQLPRIGRERFERTWCCPTLNLERRAAWYAKRWRRVRERWEASR